MAKRSIALITITLFVGAMAGTLIGELLGLILPEGVVKDFFLTGVSFNLGGLMGNDSGVIVLNMIMFTIQFHQHNRFGRRILLPAIFKMSVVNFRDKIL